MKQTIVIKSLLIGNAVNKRMIELHLECMHDMKYRIKKVGYNVAGGVTWNFPADDLEGVEINFTELTEDNISCDDFFPESVQKYMNDNGLQACGFR